MNIFRFQFDKHHTELLLMLFYTPLLSNSKREMYDKKTALIIHVTNSLHFNLHHLIKDKHKKNVQMSFVIRKSMLKE